jgi:GTP1/Obg family GTP-binding protein
MHDLKRDGGAYLSDYDDEIRQAKECFRCSADFERKIAKAKRERDEWRSRCESLESTWLSAQVEAAAIREALEKMMGASRYAHETGDLSPVPEAYNRCEELLVRNDTGRDLLERVREAESIIKRTAQDRHRLIRNAACKQCKEFPCEGDDRVLCIHKNLMTDIDAFLKDTPAPFTGVEPFEATVSPLNCDGYKKGGGEDA